MRLDYIPKVNEHGDKVVRLYDFNMAEAILFRDALKTVVVDKKSELVLTDLPFIEPRNCRLTLRISDEDTGIEPGKGRNFVCELTHETYAEMLVLLAPFCKKESIGHQYLYDIDSLTDFLFSPAGTW